jgi:hypothetical protein
MKDKINKLEHAVRTQILETYIGVHMNLRRVTNLELTW